MRGAVGRTVFSEWYVDTLSGANGQVIESRASRYDEGAPGARTPGGRLTSGDKMTRVSTLSIIDLAGSERHTSSKERNAEGKHINQSSVKKSAIRRYLHLADGAGCSL